MICYIDSTSFTAERLIAACAAPEDQADGAQHRLARRRRQSMTVRALARAMLCAQTGIPAGPWRFETGPTAPIGAVAGAIARSFLRPQWS